MYKNFLKSEIKKWSRDSMMGFMFIYPFIFIALGRFLLPWIERRYKFDFVPYTDLILVILVLLVPISYGALLGFSILEDRDDDVLINMQVTPLSIHRFLGFRIVAVYIICVLATILVMWFSDIGNLRAVNILEISILASLEAPISGLLINVFAKNKIEGFAVMKVGGSVVIFPIISLFIKGSRELLFSFAPGFWSAKAISHIIRNGNLYLTYRQYFFIGFIYMIILNILTYKYFTSKVITG